MGHFCLLTTSTRTLNIQVTASGKESGRTTDQLINTFYLEAHHITSPHSVLVRSSQMGLLDLWDRGESEKTFEFSVNSKFICHKEHGFRGSYVSNILRNSDKVPGSNTLQCRLCIKS